MWPFSLFRRKNISYDEILPSDRSIKEVLSEVAEFIPDRYKNDRQFINFQEFIVHDELILALKSLIELANESGHFFSDTFWMDLSSCASRMSMFSIGDYCSQQILRNKTELGHSIPKGWTQEKVSETKSHIYIAEKTMNEWAVERREKDQLSSFIAINGFQIKSHGRAGTIYYIEDGKVLEIEFEISGVKQYDIIIFYDSACNWALPSQVKISELEKTQIRERLIEWLKFKKIRADL